MIKINSQIFLFHTICATYFNNISMQIQLVDVALFIIKQCFPGNLMHQRSLISLSLSDLPGSSAMSQLVQSQNTKFRTRFWKVFQNKDLKLLIKRKSRVTVKQSLNHKDKDFKGKYKKLQYRKRRISTFQQRRSSFLQGSKDLIRANKLLQKALLFQHKESYSNFAHSFIIMLHSQKNL